MDSAVLAMKHGAVNFLRKATGVSELLKAVSSTLGTDGQADQLFKNYTPGELVSFYENLTPQEKEVAFLVAEGFLNSDVARKFRGLRAKPSGTIKFISGKNFSSILRLKSVCSCKKYEAFLKIKLTMFHRRDLLKFLLFRTCCPTTHAEENPKWDLTVDAIVVGSGAAGLAAAATLAEGGLSVLMLEKMNSLGGNTVISGGDVAVPGSPVQLKMGMKRLPRR